MTIRNFEGDAFWYQRTFADTSWSCERVQSCHRIWSSYMSIDNSNTCRAEKRRKIRCLRFDTIRSSFKFDCTSYHREQEFWIQYRWYKRSRDRGNRYVVHRHTTQCKHFGKGTCEIMKQGKEISFVSWRGDILTERWNRRRRIDFGNKYFFGV